jgi:hypothetical protein
MVEIFFVDVPPMVKFRGDIYDSARLRILKLCGKLIDWKMPQKL